MKGANQRIDRGRNVAPRVVCIPFVSPARGGATRPCDEDDDDPCQRTDDGHRDHAANFSKKSDGHETPIPEASAINAWRFTMGIPRTRHIWRRWGFNPKCEAIRADPTASIKELSGCL
jgi:hypothetical protein